MPSSRAAARVPCGHGVTADVIDGPRPGVALALMIALLDGRLEGSSS